MPHHCLPRLQVTKSGREFIGYVVYFRGVRKIGYLWISGLDMADVSDKLKQLLPSPRNRDKVLAAPWPDHLPIPPANLMNRFIHMGDKAGNTFLEKAEKALVDLNRGSALQ